MRYAVHFTGRVQGVGFRATARQLSVSHPVTGWVRNEPDGSVSLEVQGSDAAVEAYLTELSRIMAGRIHACDRTPLPERDSDTDFVILR